MTTGNYEYQHAGNVHTIDWAKQLNLEIHLVGDDAPGQRRGEVFVFGPDGRALNSPKTIDLRNQYHVRDFLDDCRTYDGAFEYKAPLDTLILEMEATLKEETEGVLSQNEEGFIARDDPHETSSSGVLSLLSLLSHSRYPELAPEAWYGIVAKLVQLIAPQSEADPVALLAQALVYLGTVMGNQAHFDVEATQHHTNLDMVCVGDTSKGRKGTAYDHVELQAKTADPTWSLLDNVTGGCGSGEGLIYAVRDRVMRREPIKVKGQITGYQDVEGDPGVSDKRLLVYESEFASVLKVAAREGNLLSVIIRQAWESGNLRNTVKNNPLRATGAHIAFIGHITSEELKRLLTTTEVANGFGNRFLWLCVKRSKVLPDGGDLSSINFQPILEKLRKAITMAKASPRQMYRDAETRTAWHAVYPLLSEGQPGLAGALLARGEAQVLRLSMIYALLDQSYVIRQEHLYAALAIWQYVEASIRYLYGQTTGDPLADTIVSALEMHPEHQLSKTDISYQVLQRHTPAQAIDRALHTLATTGVITLKKGTMNKSGGRPTMIVQLNNICDKSDKTPSDSLFGEQQSPEIGEGMDAIKPPEDCDKTPSVLDDGEVVSEVLTQESTLLREGNLSPLEEEDERESPPALFPRPPGCGHDAMYLEQQGTRLVCLKCAIERRGA